MIIRRETLAGIKAGTITAAYRRWSRPTVRTGGSLLTAVGQLRIATVTPIELNAISLADAKQAGYRTREALLEELEGRSGLVYRIEFGGIKPDPRVALQSTQARGSELEAVVAKLKGMDSRSSTAPWTLRTLALIRDQPGIRAADLCPHVGQTLLRFKQNVRKLKALGLTESLDVGYRLSLRGAGVRSRT